MSNTSMTDNILQKQAWDYFQMHASQRLTTFNFYLVISSLITTTLFSTFQKDYQFYCIRVIPGLLLIFVSFVFWKLDIRNKELIEIAEASLKFFEANNQIKDSGNRPHIAKVFSREEYETNRKRINKRKFSFWENHFSYSDCFNLVFICFGIVGILGTIIAFKSFI